MLRQGGRSLRPTQLPKRAAGLGLEVGEPLLTTTRAIPIQTNVFPKIRGSNRIRSSPVLISQVDAQHRLSTGLHLHILAANATAEAVGPQQKMTRTYSNRRDNNYGKHGNAPRPGQPQVQPFPWPLKGKRELLPDVCPVLRAWKTENTTCVAQGRQPNSPSTLQCSWLLALWLLLRYRTCNSIFCKTVCSSN